MEIPRPLDPPENALQTRIARDRLARDARCRFIDPARFRRLLVSTRKLDRSDEPSARTLGLVDPATGVRFLVEEELLFTEAV